MAEPSLSPPPIPERDFAKKIGVPRGVLRNMRRTGELVAEADFLVWPSGVMLLEPGAKKVRVRLGLPADAGAEELPPERVTLTVERAARGNPKIVHCLTPDGDRVRLRVRQNVNFLAGMRVPNCVQEHADLFCYQGRLPRWRGKF